MFTVEYRDLAKHERVLFETDELGPAEMVLAASRTSDYRELVAFDLGTHPCRGYGEDCGNPVKHHHGTSDLCPDCTLARLDAQSPRIPV